MEEPTVPAVLDPSGRDVHGEGAALRARGEAVRVLLPGGVPAWVITRHEVIRALMGDARVSKDACRHWPAWMSGEVDGSWPLAMWVSVRNMLTAYGGEHRRLRRLVAAAFTARRTAVLRGRIVQIVDELVEGLALVAPGQVVDLRREFCFALPIRVICELLGVEEAGGQDLHRVVEVLFTTTTTSEAARANQAELYGLLAALVAGKRRAPAADLTSELIAVRDEEGSALSEKELLDTLLLIIGAGHETTVNLLDQAVCALLTHPGQLRLAREGGVSWEAVVEETLRCRAPVANIPLRFAVEDIEVGGVRIAQGEAIVMSLAAAGRDPARHGPDADRFDVTRATSGDHLAFGYGVHHCLGRPLAMAEATVALPALFARFPHLRLAVPEHELVPLESFISSGHRELLVVPTPGPR